jgi:hypothetical protein
VDVQKKKFADRTRADVAASPFLTTQRSQPGSAGAPDNALYRAERRTQLRRVAEGQPPRRASSVHRGVAQASCMRMVRGGMDTCSDILDERRTLANAVRIGG